MLKELDDSSLILWEGRYVWNALEYKWVKRELINFEAALFNLYNIKEHLYYFGEIEYSIFFDPQFKKDVDYIVEEENKHNNSHNFYLSNICSHLRFFASDKWNSKVIFSAKETIGKMEEIADLIFEYKNDILKITKNRYGNLTSYEFENIARIIKLKELVK